MNRVSGGGAFAKLRLTLVFFSFLSLFPPSRLDSTRFHVLWRDTLTNNQFYWRWVVMNACYFFRFCTVDTCTCKKDANFPGFSIVIVWYDFFFQKFKIDNW